jgi:hypothetical protein
MMMIMKNGLDSQPLLVSLLMEGEDLMDEEKLGGKLAMYVYLLINKVQLFPSKLSFLNCYSF